MSAETRPMVRCADCRFMSGKRGSWCSRAQRHTTNTHWRRCDEFRAPSEGDVPVREDEVAVPVPGIEGLIHRAQTEPEPEVATAISEVAVRQMAGVEDCDIRADVVMVRFHRHATSEQRIAVDRMFPESGAVRRRRATIARQKSRG